VRIHGVAVGAQKLQALARGETQADHGFGERGCGDQIHARWSVDAQGLPTRYVADANDYWQVPLAEHFDVTAGKASWKNRIQAGSAERSAPGAFYLPANAPPEFMDVLARALLKAPGQRLKRLPALIRSHARLFDPRDLVVRDEMRVLVRGEHIVRVHPDGAAASPRW
jgi:hypothetical protein